ncbi:DUF309 domain-containing protein [Alicyclobacillus tolerans]|uniref:DUF309 domain-containing protein n=1 Tax=Alicyclobacillus tolerans TaxID=90970 RepID=UPI001F345EB5|nr:DUF309 domain-containing protein [Alicyclobacillus tolerans]MCF8565788.1 DUF309 domain-containing protein [Alicyclobacillus tolerans]
MEPRLISYLYFFNVKADYFECHEYGESLWLDTGRPIVLKGLIQAAVCLYHLHNGNIKGGWRMWQRARAYIAPSRPNYQGIDLDRLTNDIDAVFAKVPQALYNAIVTPAEVEAMELPLVKVCITDDPINQLLASWQPEPLSDR